MRIAVLMSTYQGEAHVEAQVASILSQLPSDGRLVVRDDGSTDRTVEILRQIADPRLEVTAGTNLGFSRSFLTLLAQARGDADMVMLSDQDDVWLPGKIERAAHALKGAGATPTMYFSRQHLVDEQLRPLGDSPCWPRGPSFANALCENIATGCTIALNSPGATLAARTGDAGEIFFHDWWIYLVICAFGRVVMDDAPTLLYRQHAHNVVGRGVGLARHLRTLAFIRKRSWVHIMYRQIGNFLKVHGDALDPASRRLIARDFDPRKASSVLRLLLWPVRRRQFLLDEFTFRALLVAELACGRGLLPRDQPTR